MSNQAGDSIGFVISACYTYTFANSIFFMITSPGSESFSLDNIEFSWARTICGVMCLVMAMRFFFGNNQYISDVMNDAHKSPWRKFYQFAFIALQSAVLLISSYFIPNTEAFIAVIAGLFFIEILWYALSILVDPSSVLLENEQDRRAFLIAEMVNGGFLVGVCVVWWLVPAPVETKLLLVFVMFAINTVHDAMKNMPNYMGK